METEDDVDEEMLEYAVQFSVQESGSKEPSDESLEHHKILSAIDRGDLFSLQDLSDYPGAFTELDDRGWYPMHRAAVQSSTQVLEMVLYGAVSEASYRLSPDEPTVDGETPLILAIQAGLVENVHTLLEHGASPHKTNNKNESPLLLAVRTDSCEIASALILGGVPVGQDCMLEWSPIHEAAKAGFVDVVRLLLQHGAKVTDTDESGVTPMATAAEYAQAEVLDILIHNGGDVNAQAPNGDSVLHDAAGAGNPDCIELLLQNGADPNVANLSSQLPIHRAAYEGHYLVLRMLIAVTTDQALTLSGQTPLHSAADGGHAQCLEYLLEEGFEVNALLDQHVSESYGDMCRTALYFTVSNRDVTCMELLLRAGANPELDPLRCLLVAVRAGSYELVKVLLASRADVNCCFTAVSDTVFPTSLQYCLNDDMMMRLLLNNGYLADQCFCCHHEPVLGDLSRKPLQPSEKIPFCDFVSVSWLVPVAGKAVRVLLDYVSYVPVCFKLRTVLEKHTLWPEICHILGRPRSLKHLCRLLIRKQMSPKDLADPNFMESFPFPPRLKRYLVYKEYDLYG